MHPTITQNVTANINHRFDEKISFRKMYSEKIKSARATAITRNFFINKKAAQAADS